MGLEGGRSWENESFLFMSGALRVLLKPVTKTSETPTSVSGCSRLRDPVGAFRKADLTKTRRHQMRTPAGLPGEYQAPVPSEFQTDSEKGLSISMFPAAPARTGHPVCLLISAAALRFTYLQPAQKVTLFLKSET